MLPEEIKDYVIDQLSKSIGLVRYSGFKFTSGGCINTTGKLSTSKGDFFIKWNWKDAYPNMFRTEFEGLKTLRNPGVITIPQPLLFGEAGSYAFLVTEFVASSIRKSKYAEELGTQLASLHRIGADLFGLDYDNYIGSLPQKNNKLKNWIDFFIQNRLQVQLRYALDNGKLNVKHQHKFEKLYYQLPSILNQDEPPALIHGDLWGGNLMIGSNGEPVLIDPAMYYGNREIEISYTKLFGGFESRFYDAYNHTWPLEPGFQERQDLYNLYPLLVHVNLFGGGYINQVEGIIAPF